MIGHSHKNNHRRSGPSIVKLGSSNFREWREELHIAALQFGNAGKALRSGIKPVYVEPGREDRKRIKPPHDIVTDAEFVNMLRR